MTVNEQHKLALLKTMNDRDKNKEFLQKHQELIAASVASTTEMEISAEMSTLTAIIFSSIYLGYCLKEVELETEPN